MHFALTEEQQAIFDMAHAFGQEHIAPFAREWEAEGSIPKGLWPEIAALGFGDIDQYGVEGLRFWTKNKKITQRWPDGGGDGSNAFVIPTMG